MIWQHYTSSLSQKLNWDYAAGSENRSKQTFVKGGTTTITTYMYDNNDRLTSETTGATTTTYGYTGTQLTQKTKSGVTTTYGFNLQGRMNAMTEGATTCAYEYNGRGTRVSQTVGGVKTLYVIDPQNMTGYDQVIVEKNTSNAVLRSYTIGHELISQYEPVATYYFHFDGLGNTRALLSTTGTVTKRYDYDAFGNAVSFPTTPKTSHLYCGEMLDTKTGYYYLRARYYDPRVGRFNRLDPFFGNLSDPQSLHKYTYCHGDPVNFSDPSGMAYFFAELGKAAHKLINDLYEMAHPGHIVTYGKGIPGFASLRPDIMNYSKAQIGEIKPCSAYGFATGPVQLWAAINIANSLPVAHYKPGGDSWKSEEWNPGIQVLFPGTIDPWFSDHLIVTLGNLNGLILYKTLHIPVKVLPVLAIYMLADKIAEIAQDMMKDMRFGFDPVLEPIYNYRFELLLTSIAITGVAAWGVATRNTVETVRANTMMAISSLLSVRVGAFAMI